jgi:hypothetical protein
MLKFCPLCGKMFSKKPSSQQRFCGADCRKRWYAPMQQAIKSARRQARKLQKGQS